jgi:acetolactate decarboxylase
LFERPAASEQTVMHIEAGFVHALQALRRRHRHAPDHHLHEIYQVSTINALLEGVFDGDMSYGALKAHGDFGIGTFNGLDGEMIAFDGRFRQIRSNGHAYPVPDDACTPFATVLFFAPKIEEDLAGPLDFAAFKRLLDTKVTSSNLFCAIRVDGTFGSVSTRSMPRQSKPYPPLVEVAEHQPEFDLSNVEGTLAGFRFPDFASGMNVPGYHLHFLSRDERGGHVLDFELGHGRLAIDTESDLHIELPTDPDFLNTDLSGDHRDDLKKVEE